MKLSKLRQPPTGVAGLFRRLGIAAIVLGTLGAILLELTCPAFRDFTVSHPLLTGVVLVALTVLGVERLIALQESRRWRNPALSSIETYMYSADRAAQSVQGEILAQTRSLPSPPSHEPRLREALEIIAKQDRARLRPLSAYAREQADVAGHVAMSAYATLGRHAPAGAFIEPITRTQAMLGSLSSDLNSISFMSGGLGGEKDATFRDLIAKKAQEAEQELFDLSHLLAEMKFRLDDLRGAI
jgi:hypothetical protein